MSPTKASTGSAKAPVAAVKAPRRRKLSRWQRVRVAVSTVPMRRVLAIAIAVPAAYASYRHIFHVARVNGQDPIISAMMPLMIDAAMILAATYISHAKTASGRVIAYGSFGAGLLASLTANVLSSQPEFWHQVVAGWPAVTLLLTALMIHFGDRKPARRSSTRAARSPQIAATTPVARTPRPASLPRRTTVTATPLPWSETPTVATATVR